MEAQDSGRGRPVRRRRHLHTAFVLAVLMLLLQFPVAASVVPAATGTPDHARPLHLKIKPAGVASVELVASGDGHHVYRVRWRDGREKILTPDQFADLLYEEYSGRTALFAVLNITSWGGVLWVALGLFGQLLFTGRMVVQWLVSEKRKRSVVPVAFWWMSLGGATMLLIYFLWRKDIVGVLGQSTGWFIYSRNLWLIYHHAGPRESASA